LQLPLIFAHRGANSFAPENSIAAFEKAIELGCDGIELDVRLCADEELVVFHDRFTNRMTGHRGSIQKMTYSEIKQLILKGSDKNSFRIPNLTEILELAGKKLLINIDIKKDPFSKNNLEEKIIQILKRHQLKDNIILSSFNPFVLKKIALLYPGMHNGFIFRNRSSMMFLNGQPVQSLHARYRILDKKYISNLTERAAEIYAWTIDEARGMLEQIQNGIHGIISNKPEIFLQLKKIIQQDGISLNELVTQY
jgi:glycerophosphoryl diester phosphodiesterase